MEEVRRGLDILSDEDRERCIKAIVSFVHDEWDKEIGVIAAGNILDFFLQQIGPDIYNKGIDEAKKTFQKQLESWEVELDLLKKQK
jgi:uncharacterized protein (DUF2164 family)